MPKIFKNKNLIKRKKEKKRIPREIPFLEMYNFIYFTLLFLSYDKNNLHKKKLQFCEGGTILKVSYIAVV